MQVFWRAAKWQLDFTPEKQMNEERRQLQPASSLAQKWRVVGAWAWAAPGAAAAAAAVTCRAQAEGTVEEGAWGPLPKSKGVTHQQQVWEWGGLAIADSWRCGTRLELHTCSSLELIWLDFLPRALAVKALISFLKRHINDQQGSQQPGFIL